jgi:hypothetical protein
MNEKSINVSTAAPFEGQAAPGEVLVTEDVYKAISAAFPGAIRAEYSLKGISPSTGWCGIKNYKWNELNFCVRTLARNNECASTAN